MKRGKLAGIVVLITRRIRNVSVIRVPALITRRHKRVRRVMFRARFAIPAGQLSTREPRMPAQVTRPATAAARAAQRFVIPVQLRNSVLAKAAALIPTPANRLTAILSTAAALTAKSITNVRYVKPGIV